MSVLTTSPQGRVPTRNRQTSNGLKSKVLSYQHDGLISRLMKKENMGYEEAKLLHDDVMKFLYVCEATEGRHAPTSKLDIGWHHFILYTRDYAAFCHEHFGRFIHHNPGGSPTETFPAVLHTCTMARHEFGDNLSANWEVTADVCDACAKCFPG